MSEKNWDISIGIRFFLAIFIIAVIINFVLGGIFLGFSKLNELNIDWGFIVITSLVYGIFGANRYRKSKIEISIIDKVNFATLLKDCLEYTGFKISSENKNVFILKPRLGMRIIWLDIGMAKESIIITVEENQAILVGPDLYVKKIKTLLDASL